MKKTLCSAIPSILLLLPLAGVAWAEDTALSGYPASFSRDFDRASGKLVDLAEAIPADKYAWRPTDGVRTVSEVLIHVASANFGLSAGLGVPMPEGFNFATAEKDITEKAAVVETLKKSIDHVHEALEAKAGGNLDEEVELPFGKFAVRDVFMIIGGHAHEHLGQSIAYARMGGVVPPWSAGGGDGGN